MSTPTNLAYRIPRILLPKQGADLTKWAVIACDQFTSEPEYWADVERTVGDAPSTYHMILPEAYLDTPREAARLKSTQAAMAAYVKDGLFHEHHGMIYVERTAHGRTRKGLMLCMDLDAYDFSKGSQSLIRATEATVVERLPPRIRIREAASLELPHILVLIDDPQRSVIEPVGALKAKLPRLYDTELMLGSGHLTGYSAATPEIARNVARALAALADPDAFRSKYGVGPDKGVLQFAVGDGNHSLATAKAIWERLKGTVPADHPARFALVEIENVHDEGLVFEPIHRVLFGVKDDVLAGLRSRAPGEIVHRALPSSQAMIAAVRDHRGSSQVVGVVSQAGFCVVEFTKPASTLAVGTLQALLDNVMKDGGADKIDYVHGDDVVCKLGSQSGNWGFYLPNMDKGDLFKTVILEGVLPRKTFSMGEAREKRFYMECRAIA